MNIGAEVHWVERVNGTICRGEVVSHLTNDKLEVIRYKDNGSFGGINYIDVEQVIEIIGEGSGETRI